MKIVLMRHGEPKLDLLGMLKIKCTAYDLKGLIRAYTENGLNPQITPRHEAIGEANRCKAFVCSDLPRSIESARVLGLTNIAEEDGLYRESDLPHAQWRYPKLAVFTGFVFFRVLWFLGYAKNGEPIAIARQRAQTAAIKLKQLAEVHGSVLLIGHGIFNRLIAGQLRSNGWIGPKNPGNHYWDYGVNEPITREPASGAGCRSRHSD